MIKMKPSILQKMRLKAIKPGKTLRRWIENAIEEKIEREETVRGYCKAILKISQTNEGLRDSKHRLPASPSSSFLPFFKGPSAGRHQH